MPTLKDYIQSTLEKGYSEAEVYSIFLEKGYKKEEICASFPNAGRKVESNYTQNTFLDILKKSLLLFYNPKEFFESVKEKSIGKSTGLFFIASGIVLLMGLFLQIVLAGFMSGAFGGINYIGGIFGSLFGMFSIIIYIFAFAFASVFVFAGISHGILKLFGGEGKYLDTCNVYFFSTALAIICTIIPFIGLLAFIYSIVLMVLGFAKYHNISYGKSVVGAIAPLIFIVLIIGFFILYFSRMMF